MKGKMGLLVIILCLTLPLVPVSAGEWNRVTRLTYSGTAEHQVLMVDGEDYAHIIYQESSGGRSVLRYMKLDETGYRLAPSKTITSGAGYSIYPAAALNDQGIYLVWWDNREGNYGLYYTLLDHNGTREMPEKTLAPEMADNRTPAEAPNVALDSHGHLFIVWSQHGRDMDNMMDEEELRVSVFLMKIDEAGNILAPPVRISTGYANGIYPDVVVDGRGRAHVVWSEDVTGNYEVYYTVIHGQDSPRELDVTRLTDSPMESVMSCLLLHADDLYLGWSDGGNTGEIYSVHFGRISKTGLSFNLRVSDKGNALYPSMASKGDRIVITWQDDRHSLAGSKGRDAYEVVKDNLTTIKSYLRRHLLGEQDFDSRNAVTNWEIYLSIIDGNGGIIENNSRVTALRRASITPEISVDSMGAARCEVQSTERRMRAEPSTRNEQPKGVNCVWAEGPI
ncbi:MAG: hypothetical protein KAU14_07980, partial [Thermoplasmata archaeon]|nr:hypothetical protein [Thermoplasmata archaeon]